MKYILFILLFTLIFCIDSKSQTNQFNGRVNTIIITDSLITINNLQQLLLKNGYLFTYKSESILVTDYKTTINVHDIVSIVCNKIDDKIYVRANYLYDGGYYGQHFDQVAYVGRYKKIFNEIYNMLQTLKPGLDMKAVVF